MLAGLGACAVIMLVALVAVVVDSETKRRNHNVRLPRKTAWDRAAKYYQDTH